MFIPAICAIVVQIIFRHDLLHFLMKSFVTIDVYVIIYSLLVSLLTALYVILCVAIGYLLGITKRKKAKTEDASIDLESHRNMNKKSLESIVAVHEHNQNYISSFIRAGIKQNIVQSKSIHIQIYL